MKNSLPIAVLDFEASSLEMSGFPIEAGIAIARGPNDIESWSTLIRPADGWNVPDAWDPAAERVHNIRGGWLSDGMIPRDVLTSLNERLRDVGPVWCDGGRYDQFWLDKLCKAAWPIKPAFDLHDLTARFALDRRAYNRFADAMTRSEPAHRAEADAVRICRALIA